MPTLSTPLADLKHEIAYFDTAELVYFKPELPPAADRFHTEPITRDDGDLPIGYRIIAAPAYARRELEALDRFQQTYGGKLYRVHPAVDLITDDDPDGSLRAYLRNSVVIPWRPKGPMFDGWEGDQPHYWVRHPRRRRPNRNLALYDDRTSKPLTGDTRRVVHLELRFERTATCKRQGWHRVSDLFDADPHELFDRNIRLAVNMPELFESIVNEWARINYAQARDDWITAGRPEENAFATRFCSRAHIPRQIRGLLLAKQWDRAQVLHNTRYGHRLKLIRPDALRIPHRLTFNDDLTSWSSEPARPSAAVAAHACFGTRSSMISMAAFVPACSRLL
jgi:hypothetical protein